MLAFDDKEKKLVKSNNKHWDSMRQVLVETFAFLKMEIGETRVKKDNHRKIRFLKGVTKIVLMLAHDKPHFLSYYYLEFVSVIPP